MEETKALLRDIILSIKKDATVRDVAIGPLFTAVHSRRVGLSSTLRGCEVVDEVKVNYKGETGLELANLVFSDDILEASLGLSAINSLMEIESERILEINATSLLFGLGRGRRITVIGHFPFVEEIEKVAHEVWVIERRPKEGDYAEEMMESSLPISDIVAISGTTLINHTLGRILSICREDALKILLGPSTCLSPVLFDYGVDVLSGTLVTSEERLMGLVKEGANFRRIKKEGVVRLVSIARNETELLKHL